MRAFIVFLQWVVRNHARKVVTVHVLLVALCAYGIATGMKIDTSVDGLMSATDPDVVRSNQLKAEFTNDEVTLVAFDLGRPFTRDDLHRLKRFVDRVAAMPTVNRVESLIEIEDVRSDGSGGLDASPLIGSGRLAELDDAAVAELRAYVAEHPIYPENLVSRDLTVLAAIISFVPPDPGKANIREATIEIDGIVDEEAKGWATPWVAGYPVVEYEADALVTADLMLLSPIVFLMSLLIFLVVARRLFSLVLMCALVLWTLSTTLGFFILIDTPLNIVTSSVPAVVLTTSGVFGIYLIGLLRTVADSEEPAMALIAKVTRPSFLSMASTSVGFLSMLFIQVDALQEMGMGMAFGIFSSFVATLFLLPSLIHLVPSNPSRHSFRWIASLSQLGVRLARRPWRVIGVTAVLIVAAIPGLAQLYIETNPLDYFRESSETIRAHDFARDHLGGAGLINIVVRANEPGDALRPEVMRLAEALVEEADRHDMVDRTISLLDYNKMMDAALRPEKPPRRVLESKELASQYLALYEMGGDPSDLAPYVNHDRSAMVLRARIRYLKATAVLALEQRIAEVAALHPEAKADVRLLGSAFMIAKSADSISKGLFPGLGLALLMVLLTFAFTLRSAKLALIAIPPNVLPYLFCMAALGFSGIPLSIGTSLVGFVAIGLAVDDTAHVMAHLKDTPTLPRLYADVGLPVILTTLSIGLGFLALLASEFQMIAAFGIATSLTLVVALLADLVLLPSLLKVFRFTPGDSEEVETGTRSTDDIAISGGVAAMRYERGD